MALVNQEYQEPVIAHGDGADGPGLGNVEGGIFGKPPVVRHGVNMNGDAWCCHSPSGDCYHYVNRNGSIYYKNPDKSSYYWDPRGFSRYTDPEGREFIVQGPRLDVGSNRFCFSCDKELTPRLD